MSEMLAFGRDQILARQDILAVVDYVLSLSSSSPPQAIQKEASPLGKNIFSDNCASCHGENAKGNIELGAPDLTDNNWIYGGSRDAVFKSVWHGRKGHMPSWQERLSEVDRKILTLYLLDLLDIQAAENEEKENG